MRSLPRRLVAACAFLLLAVLGAAPTRAQVAVVFSDSPDTTQWAASWGAATGGSSLALVTTSHCPVESRATFLGSNALRLAWTAAAGGDWAMTAATANWTAFSTAPYDTLVFALWSPEGVDAANLPCVFLEDGNNARTPAMFLSAFTPAVSVGAWTRVAIPMSAFRANPGSANLASINKVFFAQAPTMTPGAAHELDVDEIRFVAAGLPAPALGAITARGWERHVDVRWDPAAAIGTSAVHVERRVGAAWTRVGEAPLADGAGEDWLGAAGLSGEYRAIGIGSDLRASAPTDSVAATTRTLGDQEWLDMTEEAAFRYFWMHAYPGNGLARERYGAGNTCATGGTGMGLMAIIAATSRGWVSRADAAARVRAILDFYDTRPHLFHGAFAHWIDGATALTLPADTPGDSAGDIVETSYLAQGLLCARQYFTGSGSDETLIRVEATHIWERIDWDAFRPASPGNAIDWLWSSTYGFAHSFPLSGWNEAMIGYILAKASPTHPIPAYCFAQGWARGGAMRNNKVFFGMPLWVGPDWGGGLYLYQYSYLGFDPRNQRDTWSPYEWQARYAALIDRAYCAANPGGYAGYSADVWGITASDDPWGYSARGPYSSDNGTLAPTASLGMMPFVPAQSLAALKAMYRLYGDRLWGPFGFRDAFNPSQNWYATSYIAIDEGPITVMIENARTGLLWDLFMANPEIRPACDSLGIVRDPSLPSGVNAAPPVTRALVLSAPAPNPFAGATALAYSLAASARVDAEILDVMGRRVVTLEHAMRGPGPHTLTWDGRDTGGQPARAGLYFVRVRAGDSVATVRLMRLR